MSSILKDQPVSVSEINPLVAEPLGVIIHRCMEKDPAKRFQSTQEILSELKSALSS